MNHWLWSEPLDIAINPIPALLVGYCIFQNSWFSSQSRYKPLLVYLGLGISELTNQLFIEQTLVNPSSGFFTSPDGLEA